MDLKNLGSFVQIESLATRDVAQSGSASVLGTGGRRFESCHPEQNCLSLYIHKKVVSPFFMVGDALMVELVDTPVLGAGDILMQVQVLLSVHTFGLQTVLFYAENRNFYDALVVQLDRISDFGSEGWGFESLRGHE